MKEISRLKWNGFGKEFESLINGIRQVLNHSNNQICLVNNVPIDDDNKAFLSIANGLGGEILRDSRMPSRAMECDGRIYRVEEDPLNIDPYAHSATNEHFSLHTDCAHFLSPPEIMMLLTCQPSETGGKTILVHLDDLLLKLNEQTKKDLSQMEFPWWKGGPRNVSAPILTKAKDNENWLIRFNQSTLKREMNEMEFGTASSLQSLIDVLNRLEKDSNHLITLSSGDLLIVHNQRVLHGRTAFSSGSPRLLKRLRMRRSDL